METSDYYPPRARAHSKLRLRWYRLRRRWHLEELRSYVSPARLILGMAFPPYAFWLVAGRPMRMGLLAVYLGLCLVFLAGLGFQTSNMAFGLLLSLHASTCAYHWEKLDPAEGFGGRCGRVVVMLICLLALFYWPARQSMMRFLFFPLRAGGKVWVVSPLFPPQSIRRGDWIAYRNPSIGGTPWEEGNVIVRGGVQLQPVRGLPGERIEFGSTAYLADGIRFPAAPWMPVQGELVVPENCWFIWPELKVGGGRGARQDIEKAFLQLSLVPKRAYLGKPFQRWFFRKQTVLP